MEHVGACDVGVLDHVTRRRSIKVKVKAAGETTDDLLELGDKFIRVVELPYRGMKECGHLGLRSLAGELRKASTVQTIDACDGCDQDR